jgi:hypothetical protein
MFVTLPLLPRPGSIQPRYSTRGLMLKRSTITSSTTGIFMIYLANSMSDSMAEVA